MQRYSHWVGAAVGVMIGVLDAAIAAAAGVRMTLNGRDVALPMAGLSELSFAIVGYLFGRLWQARARLQTDAQTIRHQLRELERSQHAALQSEKLAAIGRLAAGIAHEVRNPLGVIRASASMIHDTVGEDADARRACRFIQEETDRLDGFIATLLTFAKPTALRKRSCRARDIVDRATELAAEMTKRRGAHLTSEVDNDGAFQADPDLVTQVLLGLIVNASEAVGAGGRIAVVAQISRSGAEFRVADDGPGVANEAIDHLFEPFRTTKTGGTGLGLSMATQVVTAHGGTLDYVARAGLGPDGRGACFTLTLPAAPSVGAVS